MQAPSVYRTMTILSLSLIKRYPMSKTRVWGSYNVTLLANDICLRVTHKRHAFLGDERCMAPVDDGALYNARWMVGRVYYNIPTTSTVLQTSDFRLEP
jgi:hypothetical protein